MFRTRFAPSPTGPLHLGHAYSAMLAHDMARAEGGEFLLRIEDIDRSRARPEWEDLIYEDLDWLGIHWDGPVMRQSERLADYDSALDQLWLANLIFPCTCTRRDITEALSAPQEGVSPPVGPDGPIYPGTCRENMSFERSFPEEYTRPRGIAFRLQSHSVTFRGPLEHRIVGTDEPGQWIAAFDEAGSGPSGGQGRIAFTERHFTDQIGDIVLARRDIGTSYHLSVVVDDAAQDITHIVRGEDLFEATKIHIVLQSLLNLPTPTYHHHRLIRDENGKRLAKRDDARAIRKYREEGASPEDIRKMVGL